MTSGTDKGNASPPLVLASASKVRARLLSGAGLTFRTEVSGVDEAGVKESLGAEGADGRAIADALAELKAVAISRRVPAALVIGADQVLSLKDEAGGEVLFDKPDGKSGARDHLQRLKGREHHLITAACVAFDGRPIWRHIETPRLQMRDLSPEFIDDYIARAGDGILSSVGAYELEGLGAQLFSAMNGDYFSVLGLPLLPLLDFLREHGAVER